MNSYYTSNIRSEPSAKQSYLIFIIILTLFWSLILPRSVIEQPWQDYSTRTMKGVTIQIRALNEKKNPVVSKYLMTLGHKNDDVAEIDLTDQEFSSDHLSDKTFLKQVDIHNLAQQGYTKAIHKVLEIYPRRVNEVDRTGAINMWHSQFCAFMILSMGIGMLSYIPTLSMILIAGGTLELYRSNFLLNQGITPLAVAIGAGNSNTAQLLIERGADVNIGLGNAGNAATVLDVAGITPLVLALGPDLDALGTVPADSSLVSSLIRSGCDVNIKFTLPSKNFRSFTNPLGYMKNIRNMTPLHLAANNSFLGVVKLLLERGANVSAYNSHKDSALHYACRKRDIEIVNLLIEYGADTSLKNNFGKSPLEDCKDYLDRNEISKVKHDDERIP